MIEAAALIMLAAFSLTAGGYISGAFYELRMERDEARRVARQRGLELKRDRKRIAQLEGFDKTEWIDGAKGHRGELDEEPVYRAAAELVQAAQPVIRGYWPESHDEDEALSRLDNAASELGALIDGAEGQLSVEITREQDLPGRDGPNG